MGFLYANIVEAMDKAAVENAYRGDSGTSSRTVESGESASVPDCWLMALTNTQYSLALHTARGGPSKTKVALYDADDRQLKGAPSRSLQETSARLQPADC